MKGKGTWNDLFIRSDGIDMRTLPLVQHGVTGTWHFDYGSHGELTSWPPRQGVTENHRPKGPAVNFTLIGDSHS